MSFLSGAGRRIIILIGYLLVSFPLPQARAQSNLEYFFGNDGVYADVVVSEVVSSDTIILKTGETVKLIGLRGPEPPRRRTETDIDEFGFPVTQRSQDPVDDIELQAWQFARELLEGKHVRLEFDTERKDKNFKTLAYVFLIPGDLFVNAEILRQGFADLSLTPGNTQYAEELRRAYREAKEELRGIWNE